MCYLGNCDGARDVLGIGGGARILEHQLHVVDGDDLALALGHVAIAVGADDLANAGLGGAVLGLDLEQVVLEPLSCPARHVLVDPVPVVWVVEDHLVCAVTFCAVGGGAPGRSFEKATAGCGATSLVYVLWEALQ